MYFDCTHVCSQQGWRNEQKLDSQTLVGYGEEFGFYLKAHEDLPKHLQEKNNWIIFWFGKKNSPMGTYMFTMGCS